MEKDGEKVLSAQFWCNVTPFKINTCKSVSKQKTLTPFRMNTYEKRGGVGLLIAFLPQLEESRGALNFEGEDGVHDRRAAVHVKDLAGHPARFFHADEHDGVGDVLRRSRTPRRAPSTLMPGFDGALNLGGKADEDASVHCIRRPEDDSRADGVHGDAAPGESHGEVAHERLHGSFRRSHPDPRLPTPCARARRVGDGDDSAALAH